MMKECPYTASSRDVSENTPPEAREIARGRSPRAISRAEGCKIPAQGKSRGPRGVYFPIHPDSRQCTDILSSLSGKYWFFVVTTDGAAISQVLFEKNLLICNHSRELLLLGDPFLPLNRPYLYSICRYWIKIQLHSLSKSGKIEFCPFCTRAQPSWVDELLHRLVLRRGARDRGTIS